jgi:hypothetical protein
LENDYPVPGKTFNIVVASVAAVAVILGIIVPLLAGLSGSETEALASKRKALNAANSLKGPLPTPDAVSKFEDYRAGLDTVKESVDGFFTARNDNLYNYFTEYDERSGGDRYRRLYSEKIKALYKGAEPVLVRDPNGKPAPMKEIFAFEDWDYTPGPEEIPLAQAKFNITQAVVDVLLEVEKSANAAVKAGAKHLLPRLHEIRVKSPPADAKAEVVTPFTATVQLVLDPRDVPAVLSLVVGPGKHGLLVKLSSLTVTKTDVLDTVYEETIKKDETPKLKTEGFLKPVHVTLGFVVLDYVGPSGKG